MSKTSRSPENSSLRTKELSVMSENSMNYEGAASLNNNIGNNSSFSDYRSKYDISFLKNTNVDNFDQIRISSLLNPIKLQSDFGGRIGNSRVGILVIGKNETNTIKKVMSGIEELENKFEGGFLKLFVDDSSTDDTLSKALDYDFTILKHKESLGIGGAIKTGYYFFRKYKPEIVVQIDSDGEHPVKSIPYLIQTLLEENLDVVIGSRYLNGNLPSTSIIKIMGVKTLSLAVRTMSPGLNISDVVSGFRAFRTTCIDDIFFSSEKNWAIEFALRVIRNKNKLGEIPVEYSFRKHGISQFKSPQSYLNYGMNIIKQVIRSANKNDLFLF